MSERARWHPLRSPAELQALAEEAERDNHIIVWPTHQAIKQGEISGYASLGNVALLNMWSHSQRMTARDSLTLWREMEEQARAAGFPAICVPCAQHSPFRALMPRMGYQYLFESGYFIKTLKKGGS